MDQEPSNFILGPSDLHDISILYLATLLLMSDEQTYTVKQYAVFTNGHSLTVCSRNSCLDRSYDPIVTGHQMLKHSCYEVSMNKNVLTLFLKTPKK